MTITLSTQSREDLAASSAFLARFNSGSIKFYTATRPAGPGTAITSQTLLGTCTLSATAIAAGSVDGIVTFNSITSGTAVASGTCTWARFLASDGTTALMDVKVSTSGADINFDNNVFVSGGTIALSSLTLTMPAGVAD